MRFSTAIVVMVFLTLAAGVGGGYLGVHYGLKQASNPAALDTLLHQRLRLSADQRARIAALQSSFAAQRQALEAELARARRELAGAIAAEHHYGPQLAHAVTRLQGAADTDAVSGLSQREAALEQALTEKAVEMRIRRAKRQLAAALPPLPEAPEG